MVPNKFSLSFIALVCIKAEVFGYSHELEEQTVKYALSLFEQRDYYRAISQLKQVQFFADNESLRAWCNYKIGEAYHKSRKYRTSVRYFEHYLNGGDKIERAFRSRMYLGAGYFNLDQHDFAARQFQLAESLSADGLGALWLAYNSFYVDGVGTAIGEFGSIARSYEGRPAAPISEKGSEALNSYQGSLLRPKLASTLSAFVPGLGQLYARHYYDAIQSFVLVGSFVYLSYASYTLGAMNKQSHVLTGLSMTVAGMFHYANVIGAGRTASYRNMRNREQTMERVRFFIQEKWKFSLDFGFTFSL